MKLPLPKNVVSLGFVSFLNDIASEMLVSVFPVFFAVALSAGAGALGLVEGIADATANFMRMYVGKWSDETHHRKPFISLGYILSAVSRPIYLLSSTALGAMVPRFIDRVGKGVREAPRDAVISLSSEKKHIGFSFGFHRAMDTLGALIGPLIVFFIFQKHPGNFSRVFLIATVIGILSCLLLLRVKEVEKKKEPVSILKVPLPVFKMSSRFMSALGILFIFAIATVPVALILFTGETHGISPYQIPLYYLLYSLSFVLVSPIAGFLADKIGELRVLLVGYMFLGLGYLIMFSGQDPILFGISLFVMGVAPACTDGTLRAYAAKSADGGHQGTIHGLVQGTLGFGALFAGLIFGWLIEHASAQQAFMVAGGLVSVGILIFIFHAHIHHRTRNL